MLFVIAYIAAIVCANLTVAHFGPWFSPINAFLLIGLDLAVRDHLHDRWRGKYMWPRMLGLIAAAGAISFALNPAIGKIALASVIAFCAAGLVDTVVYHWLRHHGYMVRANGSNTSAAAVDSLLFPAIAFGGFMPAIVALQFAAKVFGGGIWAWIIHRSRLASI